MGAKLPHELLLTARQKTKLRYSFKNNTSADTKLPKTQISKITQSSGFLSAFLGKIVGPLMKVTVPLTKNILIPLGVTAVASAIPYFGVSTARMLSRRYLP